MVKIIVRKEVILCLNCNKPNEFFYLSDYSYGEKLISLDGKSQYAYINLIENSTFTNYTKMVLEVLEENGIELDNSNLSKIMNESFFITCDRINGCSPTFELKKCFYCESYIFDNKLYQPEEIVELQVNLVTYNKWELLSTDDKKKAILNELEEKNIIK